MTVEFVKEMAGCRMALESGLQTLGAGHTPAAQGHLAAVANAESPPPLPVYVLPLDDLAAGNFLKDRDPVAWDYLLVSGGHPVRVAEIHPDPTDPQKSFAFAAISAAPAAGIAQAIAAAETDPCIRRGQYEMRLVRVPALYVTALWLKNLNGTTDAYVVIPPTPEGFGAHVILSAPDFFKLLQTKAAEKVRTTPSPQPSGPPSN
jgi:hypothetical protein